MHQYEWNIGKVLGTKVHNVMCSVHGGANCISEGLNFLEVFFSFSRFYKSISNFDCQFS